MQDNILFLLYTFIFILYIFLVQTIIYSIHLISNIFELFYCLGHQSRMLHYAIDARPQQLQLFGFDLGMALCTLMKSPYCYMDISLEALA